MSRSFYILLGILGVAGFLSYLNWQRTDGEQGPTRTPETDGTIGGIAAAAGAGILDFGVGIGSRIFDLIASPFLSPIGGPADIPGPAQDEAVVLARRLSEPPWAMSSEEAIITARALIGSAEYEALRGTGGPGLLDDNAINQALRSIGLSPAIPSALSLTLTP